MVMNSFHDDVVQWHKAFGVPVLLEPTVPAEDRQELRKNLINEEHKELIGAIEEGDLVEIADACADLIYVICGTAAEYGIPLNRVWDEVQRSNMAKLGKDGKPILREDGKVLKPEDWTPPNIAAMLWPISQPKLARVYECHQCNERITVVGGLPPKVKCERCDKPYQFVRFANVELIDGRVTDDA